DGDLLAFVVHSSDSVCFFFFFFQAEDGIRDSSVTGVQTCALPISPNGTNGRFHGDDAKQASLLVHLGMTGQMAPSPAEKPREKRSEERRVGKECRYGWTREHKKKNR